MTLFLHKNLMFYIHAFKTTLAALTFCLHFSNTERLSHELLPPAMPRLVCNINPKSMNGCIFLKSIMLFLIYHNLEYINSV